MEVDTGAQLTSSPSLTNDSVASIRKPDWDHAFSDVKPDPTGTVLLVETRMATVFHTPSDAGAMTSFESGAGRQFGDAWIALKGRICTPDHVTDSYYTPSVAVWRARAQGTLEEIEDMLYQDRNEANREGESGVTDAAITACKRLACHIVDSLADRAGFRWAAFGEDSGSASLVLQSDVSGRRVDFRISPEGRDIAVISIDNELHTSTVRLVFDDHMKIRERAAWVHRHP